MPLEQIAIASEILDANSTATVVVTGPLLFGSAFTHDWAYRPLKILSIASSTKPGIDVHAEQFLSSETSTANRDVLLEDFIQVAEERAPGIFIAARPMRRRLFEMQFKFPQGGLPKRKPFIWVPESATEE